MASSSAAGAGAGAGAADESKGEARGQRFLSTVDGGLAKEKAADAKADAKADSSSSGDSKAAEDKDSKDKDSKEEGKGEEEDLDDIEEKPVKLSTYDSEKDKETEKDKEDGAAAGASPKEAADSTWEAISNTVRGVVSCSLADLPSRCDA